MTQTLVAPPRRRRTLRVLLRLVSMLVLFVGLVFGLEWLMREQDWFGVNHGPNTMRYRLEALDLVALRGDGTRDLDGALFRHKPSKTTSFRGFDVTTNALGFRGPEVERNKPAGTYRIVALGDSVTLAWGVNDEHSWCRRLEQRLNERRDGRRYEVVNTGHLAYDTMQEAAVLEREALALSPDLVILTFVTNDVVDPTYLLIEALLDGKTQVSGPPPTLWQKLRHQGERYLPAWTALLTNAGARLGATAQSAEAGAGLQPSQVPAGTLGWERSQKALRRIRDLCRERSVPFLVFDHTLPPLPILADFCRDEGIPRFDLRFTGEELGQPIYNSLIDTHANARGNELLLEKALRALDSVNLPPKK